LHNTHKFNTKVYSCTLHIYTTPQHTSVLHTAFIKFYTLQHNMRSTLIVLLGGSAAASTKCCSSVMLEYNTHTKVPQPASTKCYSPVTLECCSKGPPHSRVVKVGEEPGQR
jgi:hypothetical protein